MIIFFTSAKVSLCNYFAITTISSFMIVSNYK